MPVGPGQGWGIGKLMVQTQIMAIDRFLAGYITKKQ